MMSSSSDDSEANQQNDQPMSEDSLEDIYDNEEIEKLYDLYMDKTESEIIILFT